MDQKKLLRKEMSALIESFDSDYILESDKGIAKKLIESEQYQNADTIFTYVGVDSEIATIPIITHAWSVGKKVCVPITRGKGIMDVAFISDLKELKKNPIGLLEPNEKCEIVNPKNIGFVIVPCLTCDPFGNRLGYGGGYYDRYLKKVDSSDACFIVVCRSKALSMHLPYENNDVSMNYYLTEEALTACLKL